MSLFFSHRLDETVARASEALEVAERAGSEKLRVETMFLIGLKHLCYGELKEARGLLDQVVETSQKLNHKPGLLSGLTWRACLHFFQSEYEPAIVAAKEALNGIDTQQVHRSYRFEQGFTFELNLLGASDEAREEFLNGR